MRLSRRKVVTGMAAALAWGAPGLAWAGSYLNRARILVDHAREEADYLRARLDDLELARLVQRLADGRLSAARSMVVPKEVDQAHPHLLLMLENYERAAAAAIERRSDRFLTLQNQARDEEQIFRGILRQLGWPLPD